MHNQPTTLARSKWCQSSACPRLARRNVNGIDLCQAHHEALLTWTASFVNGPEMRAVNVEAVPA